METSAPCFLDVFSNLDAKAAQWRAFIRRGELKGAPPSFPEVWRDVVDFLLPVAESVQQGHSFEKVWSPDVGWGP